MTYLDTLAATLSPLASVLPLLPLLPLLLAAVLLTVGAMATDRSESWIALSDRYQPDRATVLRRIGPDPIVGRARWAPRPVAVPAPAPVVVPSVPMARPALFTRPLFLLVPVPADRRPAFAPPVAA